MVRHERWKYNTYLDGAEELYDLGEDPGEWNNLAGEARHAGLVARLRKEAIRFWEPDKQMARFENTPVMRREKHFYPYSNQFVLGEGVVVDGRP
jgi:choline-sulfatase